MLKLTLQISWCHSWLSPQTTPRDLLTSVSLWGNLVITGAGGFGNSPRIIATDKETGKVVWETSFSDTPDVTFTAAPLAIKDKIIKFRCRVRQEPEWCI
jgi:alcohol dehydrogenase (cytochrome c)